MWVAINRTVSCAFRRAIASENLISVPRAEGGRKTKLFEGAPEINPRGAILPVVLMICKQPLTLSHWALWGPMLHSLETGRQA